MPDLEDELHRLAGQAAREAWPLAPAEVIRRGNRRRRRRMTRNAAAAVTVAGAVAAGVVLSGTTGGGHTLPERPASHSRAPASRSASPVPRTPEPGTATPQPAPTVSGRLATPLPGRGLTPSPVPTKSP